MYRDIPDDIRNRIEPVVVEHGFELVNTETMQGTGHALLKITIDTGSGDGRVPVDALAAISREVETQLDAADVVSGSYRLEVSSPGLNRMLAREKDFTAACGSEVKLKTRRPISGQRRFKGLLVDYVDGVVHMKVDGKEREIPFAEIEKANTVYSFSSADFNGRGSDRASD